MSDEESYRWCSIGAGHLMSHKAISDEKVLCGLYCLVVQCYALQTRLYQIHHGFFGQERYYTSLNIVNLTFEKNHLYVLMKIIGFGP